MMKEKGQTSTVVFLASFFGCLAPLREVFVSPGSRKGAKHAKKDAKKTFPSRASQSA
jgi:hypothetical protein